MAELAEMGDACLGEAEELAVLHATMVTQVRPRRGSRAVTGLCNSRSGRAAPRCAGSSGSRIRYSPGLVGSVIKKRRKKMRKHKHKKMLKKTRWQRRG
jgi:hypothetical protein